MSKYCAKVILTVVLMLTALSVHIVPVLATHQCGNGVCQPVGHHNETCSTCATDCGVCSTPTPAPTPTSSGDPTPEPGTTSTPTPTSSSASTSSNPSPSISITSLPFITNKTSHTVNAEITITDGSIASGEYSTNSGASWTSLGASDGSFNSREESISFTVSLSEGTYTIKVRAKSQAGQTGEGSKVITVVTTPPTVNLLDFKESPTKNQNPKVFARASSNLATVTKVEISFDNGKKWFTAINSAAGYIVTASGLEDGDYTVLARAFDNAGNVGQSESKILIVDTIPPIIGGLTSNLGSQVLSPNSNGYLNSVTNAELTIAMSMKGGVTEAKIVSEDSEFELSQLPGTNLWTTKVQFETKGKKTLSVVALDGAKNRTERNIATLLIEEAGRILDKKNGQEIENGTVSLFYFDTVTNRWVLWEGESFGQKNPQTISEERTFSFFVPKGRYYLEIRAAGFHPLESEVLEIYESTVLNPQLKLSPAPKIEFSLPIIGNVLMALPTFIPDTVSANEIMVAKTATENVSSPLLNKNAPNLFLADLKGKNTLLSFFSPWSPQSKEQAPILSDANNELKENQVIFAISLQESPSTTDAFMKRGGYTFTALADENGESAREYQISFLPQHFLIDSQGLIREVYTGILDKKAILEKLGELE